MVTRYPQFSFTVFQQQNIVDYNDFRHVMPDYYCCLCLKALYPEDVHFRRVSNIEDLENMPCQQWGFEVTFSPDDLNCITVCQEHVRINPFQMRYCGPNVDSILEEFNYRKRSALSPINIMTKLLVAVPKHVVIVDIMNKMGQLGRSIIWSLPK